MAQQIGFVGNDWGRMFFRQPKCDLMPLICALAVGAIFLRTMSGKACPWNGGVPSRVRCRDMPFNFRGHFLKCKQVNTKK